MTVRRASLTLQPDTAAPRTARRWVSTTLTEWGAEGVVHTAELVVTELATNAVLHARTRITVRLLFRGALLRVEVADASPGRPTPRHFSAFSASGRGLALVESLSTRWGVDDDGDGKAVWAELEESQVGVFDIDQVPSL